MAAYVSRYARAFADVVEQFKLDTVAVEQQLADFLAAWDSSAQLREVFRDPSVPSLQKVAVIDQFQARLGLAQQVRNLLAVLVDHGRIGSIHAVTAAYRKELQQRQGVFEAEIVTARDLSPADTSALLAHVAGLAAGKLDASFRLDPAILGGVIVRIGSTVYDGSVRGRFERLKEELAS